ncbi:MAG: methyltransferase domain-containing protein [Phycisphaerales bacterium]
MDVQELQAKVDAIPFWYHKIELPGGIVTPGFSPLCAERYSIPADLRGKRVLDIGAWDGYWTWEALKRGAREVVAIDDFSDEAGLAIDRKSKWATFDLCREALGFTQTDGGIKNRWLNNANQAVLRKEASVYDIYATLYGRFDVVFFFGTIYHLRHPLLALERIAAVCDGSIYVETASLDVYSPYRGGLGKGFADNEMVMEFYPGAEYGNNPSNWWAPTLQCLGSMLQAVGFVDVDAWPLTESPKGLSECRGFASGTKDPAREPACRPPEVASLKPPQGLRIAAVMSVPRLGFQDNMTCAQQVLWPMRIPLINVQGAFWGQCLERGIQSMIDSGADYVLTVDYDTLFTRADVEGLIRLMCQHPEAAAVVPIQTGRVAHKILTSLKTRSGQPRSDVPQAELKAETIPVATGHFGLTLLRVSDMLDVPHPWFWGQPNIDNQWGPGRIDDDIWFWRQLEKVRKKVLLANRIVIGHLELMAAWPGEDMQPVYQSPGEFHDKGKPAKCWK